MTIITSHAKFEEYLSEYEGLDIEQKGAISVFVNNSSNIIRLCVSKQLGDDGLPHPDIDMRQYYHNVIWGKNAPTTGRHT